jgi:hypothetical protein
MLRGDERLYIEIDAPVACTRPWLQCTNEQIQSNGEIWKCQYANRKDRVKAHRCKFESPSAGGSGARRGQLRLDQMRSRQPRSVDHVEELLAIFMAKANLSANAVHHGNLHSLLVSVFQAGWNAATEAVQSGSRPNFDAAASKLVPSCDRARLSLALQHVNKRERAVLIEIFQEYHYVGLSIDGVSIKKRRFLNIDVVCAISNTLPFTYDFLLRNSFTTLAFVRELAAVLNRMIVDGLRVCGITSDGCPWQMAALDWRHRNSIQSRYPEYAKLLCVSCACHRLQLAITDLFKSDETYRYVINQVHDVANLLRKQRAEERLNAICPTHCPTRWAYDFRILGFIVERFVLVREIVDPDISLDEEICDFLPLLEGAFRTIGEFEADDAPLSCVYPSVQQLVHFLDEQSAEKSPRVRAAYTTFARLLRFRLLETTNNIFQLAYALSPKGRDELRQEQMQETAMRRRQEPPQETDIPPPPQTDAPREEDDGGVMSRRAGELVHQVLEEVRLHPPVFGSSSDDDEGDLLQTGIIDDPLDPEDGDDDDLAEYGDHGVPEGGDNADTVCESDDDEDSFDPANEREESDTVPREEFLNGFAQGPPLYAQAESGLVEILQQYSREHSPESADCYITTEEADDALAAFQDFCNTAKSDLRLKGNYETNRYNWTTTASLGDGGSVLRDIARRLEVLVCNEAVSERTNSAMKRLLAPFRLKMGRDVLLSRLTLARHGTTTTTLHDSAT